MAPHNPALHKNFEVDYVIVYRFPETGKFPPELCHDPSANEGAAQDKTEARKGFEKLVQGLARVGLAIEVRNGQNLSLLVFVKTASDKRLNDAVYRSRLLPYSYRGVHR